MPTEESNVVKIRSYVGVHLVISIQRKTALCSVRPSNSGIAMRRLSKAILCDFRCVTHVIHITEMNGEIGLGGVEHLHVLDFSGDALLLQSRLHVLNGWQIV
jgi:hypothetical protein